MHHFKKKIRLTAVIWACPASLVETILGLLK